MASIGNWSSGTSPQANTWNSVCWSPIYNRFVAVSTDGNNRVMYSSNGINWSLSSAPAAYTWYSVVCSQERFVAIAIYQLNGIMYSSDGINNWQLGTAPNGEWRRACWSPQRGRFVAVGKSGAIVMYSDNGINWSTSGITGASGFTWLGVCWAAEAQGGIYVAVAEQGKVMISSNGINWALQTDVINGTWWNVCWSPQLTRFVAVAHRGTNNVMYSSNGSNWLAASGPVSCNDVCWSPEAGSYIALASDGRRMISTNGINWTVMTSSTTGFLTGLSIVWSPGVSRFVSVGYNTVMSVLVTTAPSPPQNLTADASNSQVTLNWSIPASTGGSAILEYIVTMNSVATPTNSTATSKPIIGLTNGTTYTFSVTARNAIGTSGSSNLVSAVPFTTPSAPTIGTAISLNTSAIVNWTQIFDSLIIFTTVGSSVFTAPMSGTVEVLIVGGGGGGAFDLGGGGGGGGVVYLSSVTVTAGTNYSIVVGNGGAPATNGQNSSAFGAIAAGGGTGGQWPEGSGTDGGSGGGAGANGSTINQGGGVSNVSTLGTNSGFIYGNRGGNMTNSRTADPNRAAGGGGAGGQGLDTNTNTTGNTGQTGAGSGGVGVVNAILGPSHYWGGGGGGGAWSNQFGGWGGLGGGGGGASLDGSGTGGGSALNSGANGAHRRGGAGGAGGANTGGGGGGGSHPHGPGGTGGSGIVVIRYRPIITFTTVGSFNFTAPRSGTVEVLIVGGGGGGGPTLGGGGGGGGVIYLPSVNVTANTNYPIVVGDGGPSGTKGQNSSAFGATAAGGGTSGSHPSGVGTSGGSGGGGASGQNNNNPGGGISGNIIGANNVGTAYGNRGGNVSGARQTDATRAAGGGGAGAQGLDTDINVQGDTGQYGMGSGGEGIINNILGSSYYWGGGGGGGAHSFQFGGWGGRGGGGGGAGLIGSGVGGGNAFTSGANGSTGVNTNGGAGGANTGGGGGGGAWSIGQGGSGGSGIVVIRYNPTSNGSIVTGYIVTDDLGLISVNVSGGNTSTTTINGLTNGKTYTFKVKAVSSNAGNSADSNPSNIVLPIAPTSINTGSDFIGRTLIIGSTALLYPNPNWTRIFDFNSGSTSQYIIAPFRASSGYLRFSVRAPNGDYFTQEYNTYIPLIDRYYIYVISFVTLTELKVNVYEYNNSTSTINSTNSDVKTINIPNTVLPGLINFWLGRSIYQQIYNQDDFYNGIYNKIALYNGNLFDLIPAVVINTLLNLVQSTESNVYYNDLSNYAFRPAVNNFMGVVVNRLNYNTTTGSTTTTSNITLIGTGASSGGYLNIKSSFVELSTAPIIQTATAGPGNGEITVNWAQPVNNGGSNISSYTVTSTPVTTPITVTGQTTLTTTFSGLTIGTSYTFTVVAINAAGTSPPSAASSPVTAITTTTVPSAPTNVTASSGPNIGQIKVSWIKPSNGGAPITEYRIRYFPTNVLVLTVYGEITETATVPSTSLTSGTSYRFTVTAKNDVGLSDPSAPSTPITPLTFSFNDTQKYVGGKLDISHNYTQNDIFFNWSSSSDNSFTSSTLLSNPNNRNYLFIRLEYQKLHIRCIVNFNTNTNTFTFPSSPVLIQEKYNPESFDYNITINTSGQKQTLFNTATYNYPSISSPPVFNFNLSLTNINSFLSSNSSLTSRSNSSTIIYGLESSLRPFGERLLEIVAIKIFGHPKARAAISNDNSFYNSTQLSTKVFDALNNHRNELGNYYMGIYDIQPNSTPQTINVNNFNIIFPFFLNGATQKSSINLFRNGPSVGGSLLRNGNYNIPLLLTFI